MKDKEEVKEDKTSDDYIIEGLKLSNPGSSVNKKGVPSLSKGTSVKDKTPNNRSSLSGTGPSPPKKKSTPISGSKIGASTKATSKRQI
jgi:hypothetical protein